jgi:hypothetical protein
MEDEIVVKLANGCTLRSGSEEFMAGDYVRIVDPSGEEIAYWDHAEWQEDPVVVMGAIMNAAHHPFRIKFQSFYLRKIRQDFPDFYGKM